MDKEVIYLSKEVTFKICPSNWRDRVSKGWRERYTYLEIERVDKGLKRKDNCNITECNKKKRRICEFCSDYN